MAAATLKDVGININLPFELWYSINKKTLSWYSPPAKDDGTTTTSALATELLQEIT